MARPHGRRPRDHVVHVGACVGRHMAGWTRGRARSVGFRRNGRDPVDPSLRDHQINHVRKREIKVK